MGNERKGQHRKGSIKQEYKRRWKREGNRRREYKIGGERRKKEEWINVMEGETRREDQRRGKKKKI